MALNNNNNKVKNRTQPRKMTWASWSSGMSSLSQDSEGQQFASAFADTHIQSVCVLDIDSEPYSYRMTQIVCTIGPATQDASVLMKMSLSGMTMARLDFSTHSWEFHKESIRLLREMEEKRGRPMCIALDTQGASVCTGMLKDGPDARIHLKAGQTVTMTTDDKYKEACDKSHIWIDHENIVNLAQPGKPVFIDSDNVSMTIKEVSGDSIKCVVDTNCTLNSYVSFHLPGVQIELPLMTDKDAADIQFGVEHGVDVIFASYVRSAECVRAIRKVLGEKGQRIRIVSKIENHEGLRNFDEILAESDGIMVARRSLGADIPMHKVFVAQKMMTARCNRAHKPVICAAQMLESMCSQSRPTRAEASDVANAIIDGADGVMLSQETSDGLYPLEAVRMMHYIAREAEAAIYHRQVFDDLRELTRKPTGVGHTTAMVAVQASVNSLAACIIVTNTTESWAQKMAAYRPRCPILAIMRDVQAARYTRLFRGILPVLYDSPEKEKWSDEMDERISFCIDFAWDRGIIRAGSAVIIVMSWMDHSEEKSDSVRMFRIPSGSRYHYTADDEYFSTKQQPDDDGNDTP